MYEQFDDSPSEIFQFREAVRQALLKSYVISAKEVEQLLNQELDTLYDLMEDGSVDDAAVVLAVLNDLADK